MQAQISKLLAAAVSSLQDAGDLPADTNIAVQVTRSKDGTHGDFASNLALQLSKAAKVPARTLAEKIAAHIPEDPGVARVEIAGPGFINFYLHTNHDAGILRQILQTKEGFGRNKAHTGRKILIEFVSANPTGPLHVGHGRGAAYGASIAHLLEAVGHQVQREYYINDTGRQMDILAVSVWLRYLKLCGQTLHFPDNAYQGDYIWDIAASVHREHEHAFFHPAEALDLQSGNHTDGKVDAESHIDTVIDKAKNLLTEDDYKTLLDYALGTLTRDIQNDLELFAVTFDQWYSEQSLGQARIQEVLDTLTRNGHTYQKDGALLFNSTAFGDEKDRVLIRKNGKATYFASDIAYHLDKYDRNFDQLINIWGADHHGYMARIRAALQALGKDTGRLHILLVQFANLYENGERLPMSTRSGEFVTLRQLRKQIGKDAARFFYVMRKCEQHLDFDLDLATSKTHDNPVYYVQYAHARICSILKQGSTPLQDEILADIDDGLLASEQEKSLVKQLAQFPESVQVAADQLAPHIVVNYLRELASSFHRFYNAHQVLVPEPEMRNARLKLIRATQIVLENGLKLLDVSAPEQM
ncbi:MAG: arginine--tRNA ligase [Proteobacteria bacterium]|nr:arginine--tRNA ligase [Pseudomonadota bacterium]